jgi:hypothetical protein
MSEKKNFRHLHVYLIHRRSHGPSVRGIAGFVINTSGVPIPADAARNLDVFLGETVAPSPDSGPGEKHLARNPLFSTRMTDNYEGGTSP